MFTHFVHCHDNHKNKSCFKRSGESNFLLEKKPRNPPLSSIHGTESDQQICGTNPSSPELAESGMEELLQGS